MITLTIEFKDINLSKATNKGLQCLLYLLVEQQRYEECVKVKSEMDKRGVQSLK